MKNKAIIVSGYFNPLHKGHIEYFNIAKSLGDKLIVIVNNDHQRKIKGSKEFMLEDERLLIVDSLNVTDYVLLSVDRDRLLGYHLKRSIMNTLESLIFCQWWDQDNDTIPEVDICKKLGIELLDGLGDKIQSSSWILNNKNENK